MFEVNDVDRAIVARHYDTKVPALAKATRAGLRDKSFEVQIAAESRLAAPGGVVGAQEIEPTFVIDADDDVHRWEAAISYRTAHGVETVTLRLAEIEQLDAAVEAGPHWDAIVGIKITRVNPTLLGLTIEGALVL